MTCVESRPLKSHGFHSHILMISYESPGFSEISRVLDSIVTTFFGAKGMRCLLLPDISIYIHTYLY